MKKITTYMRATLGFLMITIISLSIARSCRTCRPPVIRQVPVTKIQPCPVIIKQEPVIIKETPIETKPLLEVKDEPKPEIKEEKKDTEQLKELGKVISVESMNELDKHIKSNERVIVDVYAYWCGPCKSFAPTYEKFAQKHPEIACLKIDAQKIPGAQNWTINGQKIKVTSYPTFIVLKNGRAIGKDSGAPTPNTVERFEAKIKAIKGAEGFLS